MATIERLAAVDHTAVGRLLREAYADYSERIGAGWALLRLLGVAPAARGLSRLLPQWCISRAREQGAARMVCIPARPWRRRAASTIAWASSSTATCRGISGYAAGGSGSISDGDFDHAAYCG